MSTVLIVSILAVLFAYLARFNSFDKGLVVSFVLLTAFWMFRYGWGNDYMQYLSNFQNAKSSGIGLFEFNKYNYLRVTGDYAWTFLILLFKPFGFFGMVMVLSILENAVIYDFIKRNVDRKWYWLAVFVYCFDIQYYLIGASMMRQWLAMCIFIFSLRYLQEGKLWPYLMCAVIAGLFHTSAYLLVLLAPFAFFANRELSNKVLLWFVPLLIIFAIFVPKVFTSNLDLILGMMDDSSEYLNRYSDSEARGAVSIIGMIVGYVFPIIPFFITDSQKGFPRMLSLLYMISAIMFPFQSVVALFSRLGLYFSVLGIFAIPNMMHATKAYNIKGVVAPVTLILIVYLDLIGYINFFQDPNWKTDYATYTTIFSVPWQ